MGSIDPKISIPLIDISPILSPPPSPTSRDAVVSAVRSACEEYGFFQLTGHGIPLPLQQETLRCAKRFFALPLQQKQEMAMSKSMGLSKRGYESVGGQKLDHKPDTKEGFYIGFEMDDADPQAGTFLKGPNFWPAGLSDEVFRTPVMEYHAKVLEVHKTPLKILALGLPYEDNVFDNLMRDPVANLKLLHYPPNPPIESGEDLSLGAGAHTDFGCTTILLQQPDQDGLQVWHPKSGSWIPVPAKEDVFIVSIGDILAKWTAGKYRSALHRVVNVSAADRYSVPFFYQGDLATKMDPLDGSPGAGETVEQHIMGMFKKTFG